MSRISTTAVDVALRQMRAPSASVKSPVKHPLMLDAPLGENRDAALARLTQKLGAQPLSGQRIAVVTGHDFIPSELREYAYLLSQLGAQVDFVTDGPKTLRSDLNGGTSIQQLDVRTDIREVQKNLSQYAGVIIAANYTSKNQSGGPLRHNPLFKLVNSVVGRSDIALGLNCHALWALMGAEAISRSPENYDGLTLTFNPVLEPEARALGYADARPPNVDMHDFAAVDSSRHVVSSSAGVGNGTVRLIEKMAEELVQLRAAADLKGPTLAVSRNNNHVAVPQQLGTLGEIERTLPKAPAVDDARRFDAHLDGAAIDALVQSLRARLGQGDCPLAGKKVAVAVESLFNPGELRVYAHVLGDLGAQVVYVSRLRYPGWDESNASWRKENTFESAPQADKVYQLRVTNDFKEVQANIQDYAALLIPDGNGAKRLSYRPDAQTYEENPFFNAVSAALDSPTTAVAVNGRGLWGLLGAASLPSQVSALRNAKLAVSEEMRPEALTFTQDAVASRKPRVDTARGIVSSASDALSLVEQVALRVGKKTARS